MMLFESIIVKGIGEKFLLLINADQKQWLIPHHNMRIALQLYHPSTLKGKAIKVILPLVKSCLWILEHVHIATDCYTLDFTLNALLLKYFQVPTIEFSVFFGTPSVYKKITLQIMSGSRILGYCKISDNEDIKNFFCHEQMLLNEFREKNVKQIPECLYCGPLNEKFWIFVQTTTKTLNSRIIHKWTDHHWRFLTQLFQKTKIKCFFVDSDLFNSLKKLELYLDKLSPSEAEIFEKAIAKILSFYGNGTVEFSAYLADFTPWNIYFEEGKLYAFDFEYGGVSYPPFMDFFHFNTQVSILEKNYCYKKTFNFCKQIAENSILKENFLHLYLCYLLTVIAFYFDINKKPLEENDRCYSRWFPLVQLIVNKSDI